MNPTRDISRRVAPATGPHPARAWRPTAPRTIDHPMVINMTAVGDHDAAVADRSIGRAEEIADAVPGLSSPGVGSIAGVDLPADGRHTAL